MQTSNSEKFIAPCLYIPHTKKNLNCPKPTNAPHGTDDFMRAHHKYINDKITLNL